MQTITVESEIVNTYETDAISCAGYCQVTPAKKYYRSPTTVILNDFDWGANPEIIRVEATPREGFFFGWWEGDAWYYTEGQIENPGGDAPFAVKDNQQPKCLSDSDEQNRVTQRTIFIQTANNNKQATSPTVRAWFHPCVHCGEPSNYGAGGTVGEIKGSTLLSLTGSGYSAYSANRYGCLYWILQKIDDIGREWNATYCDRPIGIGRISPQFGGQSTGNSHQNGLDVDVRYVRKQGTGALNVRTDPNDYDFEATQALVDLFVSEGATLIVYYDHIEGVSELNTGTARELRDSPLHDHHFHVRFENPVENPPGRGDCISCPSLSQGLCD